MNPVIEAAFALFLIVTPVDGNGDLGPDQWTALDSGMTRIDCFSEALSTPRTQAAQKAFGPGFLIGFACEIDGAPEAWK